MFASGRSLRLVRWVLAVNNILSRLDKVRPNGENKWVACCPSHKDKTPSLSIKLIPDSRILMHCHAGCYTEDIVGAIGVPMTDLFLDGSTPKSKPKSTLEDRLVIEIWDAERAKKLPIKQADKERYLVALNRLKQAQK